MLCKTSWISSIMILTHRYERVISNALEWILTSHSIIWWKTWMRRSMIDEIMIARFFVIKYLTIVLFKSLILSEAMIVMIAMLHLSIKIISNIIKSVIYDRKNFSIDSIIRNHFFNLVILRVKLTIHNILNNDKIINSIILNLIKSIKIIKVINKITIINNQFKIKAMIKINSQINYYLSSNLNYKSLSIKQASQNQVRINDNLWSRLIMLENQIRKERIRQASSMTQTSIRVKKIYEHLSSNKLSLIDMTTMIKTIMTTHIVLIMKWTTSSLIRITTSRMSTLSFLRKQITHVRIAKTNSLLETSFTNT